MSPHCPTDPPEATEHPAAAETSPSADAPQGLFVALEGGDGVGKSTQAGLLALAYRRAGRTVLTTREPGGTPLGEHIREVLLHGGHVSARAEALLFAADKAHHVDTVIRPALARGEVVITDRYVDSSIAYQGAGRDLGTREVRQLNVWAVGGLVPDLTVLLDLSPQSGRTRRIGEGSGEDRLEREPDAFHARVRQHFLDLAQAEPERYLVLDGSGDPQAIHEAILARLGLLAAGVPAAEGGMP